MSVLRVFVDATALYSSTHRNWLFGLRSASRGDMFALVTSEDVLAEALARLRDEHPRWDGGQISSVREHVHDVFDEVLRDFPGDVPYPGRDVGDHHVHAAAVSSQVAMLLTSDRGLLRLADDDSGHVPYEPIDPDAFFVLLDDSSLHLVAETIRAQLVHFESRGQKADLAGRLRRARCESFAERVERRVAAMAGPRAVRLLAGRSDPTAAPPTD